MKRYEIKYYIRPKGCCGRGAVVMKFAFVQAANPTLAEEEFRKDIYRAVIQHIREVPEITTPGG